MQDRVLADAVDGGARSAWQMRGGGGGWRHSEGRAAVRRLALSVAEVHGEFIMPALADFSLQLVDRVEWRGERGERGAAGGRQGAPHADEGLLRVGEVQRLLALRNVQQARVSKTYVMPRSLEPARRGMTHDHSSIATGRIGRRVATHRATQWVIFVLNARQPCGR